MLEDTRCSFSFPVRGKYSCIEKEARSNQYKAGRSTAELCAAGATGQVFPLQIQCLFNTSKRNSKAKKDFIEVDL